ncbi:MAG: hypothetical protein KAW17_11510 [Candidatus Eisenbacteria sp.]|nr:hypothetical protein [Candidatus Eisenbacteria bacterium]
MRRVLVICAIALAFSATQVSAGPMVKPYGFVLFNTQFNSSWNADIPVVASEYETDTHDLTPNTLMTARQSRIGLKMKLDSRFDPVGKIEFDLRGLAGSSASGGVLQSAPRMRLAYVALTFLDGSLKLTLGQDAAKAFAPLSPNTIAHVSVPGFACSGNLSNRLPQIRADYTREVGPGKLKVQVAAVRAFAADLDPHDPYGTGDQEATQGDPLGAGELAVVPFGQARVSYNYDDMVTVGVAGHGGQMDFSKRRDIWVPDATTGHGEYFHADELADKVNTWGVAGDVKADLEIVGFMAEGFYGKNLGMYFSNIGLRYQSTTHAIVQVQAPTGYGGWGQLTVKPPDMPLNINIGAGMEMLNKDDLSEWSGWAGSVGQNMTIFGNVMCLAVDGCVFSLEYGYIQTKRVIFDGLEADYEADGAVNHSVNLGAKLSF